MPYSTYRRRYKKSGVRKSSRRAYSVPAAKSLVRYRFNKPEPKYADFPISYTNILFPPNLTFLTAINQGSGQGQRIGNEISKYALRLNYITSPHASATTGSILRVMCIEDRFPNKVALTSTQLIQLVITNPAGSAQGVISAAIPENFHRFRVYYDQQHMVSPPSQDLSRTPHHVVIPLRSQTLFTGTTPTDSSVLTRGALYVLAFSDTGTNGPSAEGFARLIYNDV